MVEHEDRDDLPATVREWIRLIEDRHWWWWQEEDDIPLCLGRGGRESKKSDPRAVASSRMGNVAKPAGESRNLSWPSLLLGAVAGALTFLALNEYNKQARENGEVRDWEGLRSRDWDGLLPRRLAVMVRTKCQGWGEQLVLHARKLSRRVQHWIKRERMCFRSLKTTTEDSLLSPLVTFSWFAWPCLLLRKGQKDAEARSVIFPFFLLGCATMLWNVKHEQTVTSSAPRRKYSGKDSALCTSSCFWCTQRLHYALLVSFICSDVSWAIWSAIGWTATELIVRSRLLSICPRGRSEDEDQRTTSTASRTTITLPNQIIMSHGSTRYLELLVHNVSHTDLALGLDLPTTPDDPFCLARPRFSCFDKYCRRALDVLSNEANLVSFPRYERSIESPRYSIKEEPTDAPMATGFALDHPVAVNASEIRVRGRDQEKLLLADSLNLSHIFFPFLAALLPKWRAQIAGKEYAQPVKRVIILVTGVGTPRNWTHSVTGNSTQACADLMEAFLQRLDPDLVVVKVHSDTNIFRYDENLEFVERELMPTLNKYRDAQALGLPYPDEVGGGEEIASTPKQPYNTEWRRSLSLTLSFADGSPARTHAIQASLRPYRPIYFHFWQLKTFWHESKIVEDDIEVHSFEAMEETPPVDVGRLLDPHVQLVVEEIKSFRDEMLATLQSDHDIDKFWLRKTHKPVVAVLLVQSPGQEPALYRGTNMEVSMPTGSLCAERNVIGSALAANPRLRREDLKMIAVLAVPHEVSANLRPVSSSASLMLGSDESDAASTGRKPSFGDEVDNRSDEWIIPPQAQQSEAESSFTMVEQSAKEQLRVNEPLRRIALFSRTGQRSKRHVVVQSAKDLNPLAPCGACNEWLKKIAESNPYFLIVTFTDADCQGVYCTRCHEK